MVLPTCWQLNGMARLAAIWGITEIGWRRGEYGCKATVTIMHNRNVICKAVGDADAGNGGYYYSIASFVIRMPNSDKAEYCHFVGSDDGQEED